LTERLRRSVRTAGVWDLLGAALADVASATGRDALDVVDAGGGTGGFAVPLAEEGHRVTVVDPSPDALAALERRAAEARVRDRVTAVQGDAAGLADLVGSASADVVVCHGVLDVVDDPADALRGVAAVLRSHGLASVLVAQRSAAVLARVVGGHVGDARRALSDPDGRWGDGDPLPRRFDEHALIGLFEGAGLRVHGLHGVRIFADLVPSSLADEPARAQALLELEAAASQDPAFRVVATQLHVVAGPT
jgi:SAM-dependent methyltransferase